MLGIEDVVLGVLADKAISGFLKFAFDGHIESLNDRLFWNNLFKRVTDAIATGYADFANSEGSNPLVLDKSFFDDEQVRDLIASPDFLFKEPMQLERRFIAIYGEERIEQFRKNIIAAKEIYKVEILNKLSPEGQVIFSSLEVQAEKQDQMQAEISLLPGRVASLLHNSLLPEGDPSSNTKLSAEVNNQIEQIKELIAVRKIDIAKTLLEALKNRIWDEANKDTRHELLIQLGRAYHEAGDLQTAAVFFY